MDELNNEWTAFMNSNTDYEHVSSKNKNDGFTPECSDLYISTQTKIGFLDKTIPLEEIFWKLPMIKYQEAREGIIKKIIKINSETKEDVEILEKHISEQESIQVDVISKVDSISGDVKKFKDIRKIIIGFSKKDLINFRKKKKSAFYNCFATIIRIFHEGKYKEVNIKLFNTGKLEIPGIQNIETLHISVNILTNIINSISNLNVNHLKNNIETVLINSNFSCNYYINRTTLYNILKFEYNIHSLYDPCSYPGIQCKFFYNKDTNMHDGTCHCEKKCNLNKKNKDNVCRVISFMIFRTGSILVVGNCDETILNIVYRFIVNILHAECKKIRANNTVVTKVK
jgi:TATA-box binding protein (TBP) (component of TFIID and TFIIIB)